ncbi:hypothetical protein AAH991_00390 [Microbispora sp. ZYX-F-249]|uniref:Uncharacterized protein n=1 Tax=Microbispora maris TaxID=3144104 RepID=A0ABV0ADW5_9ACTN
MDDPFGEDPFFGVVPPELGGVAECDVLDVQQHLILALPVPHLTARVAGVGEDRPDGALGPGDPGPVAVAIRVVGRGAGDAVAGQPFGDGEQSLAFEELAEDPLDDRACVGIEVETAQPLAISGLGRVRVRSQVDQAIAVRWASAEIPSLDLRHGGHRRPDPDLDPVALALADSAEHQHDQLVRLVGRVDRAAHLGHP